ncbi:MAG: hypothetical protein R6U39_05170 [Candidatus Aegiribacteria sp.]
MVDLLLVRLSRDDEKQKVIDLLVSELGMSTEEATEKVENSPVILRENVEMEQGRILQDRMYPFVDLLPKYYKTPAEETGKKAPVADTTPPPAPPEEEEPEEEEEEEDSLQQGIYSGTDDEYPAEGREERTVLPDGEGRNDGLGDIVDSPSSLMDDDFVSGASASDDDEPLVVTSAAEEVLTVQRCHICGRTPTTGEKLVPCTTCGELTCAGCYDRKEHVCEKCASLGRTVDRPLDSVPERKPPEETAREIPARERPSAPARRKSGSSGRFPGLSPTLIAITVLVALLAVFLLLDPFDIFGGSEQDAGAVPAALPDTSSAGEGQESGIAGPDTTGTGETASDSLVADSLPPPVFISLRSLTLPDSLATDDYQVPRGLTDSPVREVEVLSESLQFLAEPLGQLSAFHSIEMERFSLIRTEDGYDILVMSILHPEPAEKRAALIGGIGLLLDSTIVDQMVLYYRENQYYAPNMFSFISDSFRVLATSPSPYYLQRRQAVIPETSELVTGSVFQWMTDTD